MPKKKASKRVADLRARWDQAKWAAAKEWVRAVNVSKKFGTWEFKVLDDLKNIFEVIQ